MKLFKQFWFWFGLLLCPLLMIACIFNLGRFIGYTLVSEQSFLQAVHSSSIGIELVITLSLGVCATFEFLRSLRQAKVKFAKLGAISH
ncbi:hypothetical protein [Shewanella fidelis]|uniref:Uncharacterized protein n=1 Tax=Shewanella fidelis TaxID=173509 RepID=A0AAW8NQU0_9GAMM|nr:hypothetical protein [Shewanella fidelis]MDR8524289.1 hypothetical protein [Shewanella fidelis]MDW4813502.1 hypothetical protein [Shewanella fidelis]MDW4817575.1 hypothetical protein [Shewanella fidelis]MDW4821642.1 hypothetical protein [Shewanella fidelis]MDW4825807.1 hypothetical protein [Shewanella fidelis]